MAAECETVQFVRLDGLLDGNGSIAERFTIDGLQLSGNGLKALAVEIARLGPYLSH